MEVIRKRIVLAVGAGERSAEIARRLEVSRKMVYSIMKLSNETGGYS